MIRIISTSNIFKTKLNNTFKGKPSFKCTEDNFIKNQDTLNQTEERTKDMKFNKDPQKELTIQYSKKIEIMPLIMDRVLFNIVNFLKGKQETSVFATKFVNDTTSLAKRMNIGEDKEEYKKNYEPEITLIETVNSACVKFLNNDVSEKSLQGTVTESVTEYIKDNRKREKHFIQ